MLYLASAWIAGLFSGLAAVHISDSDLIRQAALQVPSFGNLLLITALPAVMIILALFISRPLLCLPVLFFKAFQLAYVACLVLVSYSHAGWLILFPLMFSDILALPLLWWLCIRRNITIKSIAASVLFLVLICGVNTGIFSPFLAKII